MHRVLHACIPFVGSMPVLQKVTFQSKRRRGSGRGGALTSIENRMPAPKHMQNHFTLVLKLSDEASRTWREQWQDVTRHTSRVTAKATSFRLKGFSFMSLTGSKLQRLFVVCDFNCADAAPFCGSKLQYTTTLIAEN